MPMTVKPLTCANTSGCISTQTHMSSAASLAAARTSTVGGSSALRGSLPGEGSFCLPARKASAETVRVERDDAPEVRESGGEPDLDSVARRAELLHAREGGDFAAIAQRVWADAKRDLSDGIAADRAEDAWAQMQPAPAAARRRRASGPGLASRETADEL